MANPTMTAPQLKPEDWELLAHLLECKQRELLAEIRHTTKRAFREALHERLNQVEELLGKIPRSGGGEEA
ncbi:MAG: hypothetical protein KatS3mg005_2603 [Bryobacteraceae bacterium]|nr:MAG: hypothetical protein KatS3mg005_2603 [Bryobacteraceae bacterium]